MSTTTTSAAVLPHESREEYTRLHQEFTRHHQPAGEFERELLTRMVDAWWRLRRTSRIETEFLNHRTQAIMEASEEALTPDAAMARIFSDPTESKQFTILQRYVRSAEREFQTAKKLFEAAKSDREQREEEEIMQTAMAEAIAQRRNGFVSQKAENGQNPQPNSKSPSPVSPAMPRDAHCSKVAA